MGGIKLRCTRIGINGSIRPKCEEASGGPGGRKKRKGSMRKCRVTGVHTYERGLP